MSDCVTVSDATILYCSDIECTENTCYAAVTTVGGGGATTHEAQQPAAGQQLITC